MLNEVLSDAILWQSLRTIPLSIRQTTQGRYLPSVAQYSTWILEVEESLKSGRFGLMHLTPDGVQGLLSWSDQSDDRL